MSSRLEGFLMMVETALYQHADILLMTAAVTLAKNQCMFNISSLCPVLNLQLLSVNMSWKGTLAHNCFSLVLWKGMCKFYCS